MKRLLFLLTFAFLTIFPAFLHAEGDFVYEVAAKCKGETDFAVAECVCTVHNRLLDGWTEQNVLSAYYAYPIPPTELELWITGEVLRDGCGHDYYFIFSRDDVYYLGISDIVPLARIFGETGEAWLYEENYMRRAYHPEDFHGHQVYG